MSVLIWLVPIALLMGTIGLVAFLWSLKSGQYEDLSGAAERILLTEDDRPIADRVPTEGRSGKRTGARIHPATRNDKHRT